MTNKEKQKRRLRKSIGQRGKEIARRQKEIEIMKTDKALLNIFIKSGVLNGKGA